MIILDGKKARDAHTIRLKERIEALSQTPLLALIQIGDNKESGIYIEQKKKFAKTIGALVEHVQFPESASAGEIRDSIRIFNERKDVHGIIIQLPLPSHIDKDRLLEEISPLKDVDGLTSENQNLLASGTPRFIPATAKGVKFLMEYYKIAVQGKKATVFGKSRLVGSPVAKLLIALGAEVSVCDSKTKNPREISRTSDILVVAIGKPEHIDASYVKEGAAVIDVGINSIAGEKFEEELPRRKIVGDVNFESVSKVASALSPVPGGVGPMTVLSLFDNLVESAEAMLL
jgi:5,10-methylene-tetrahydrofolate dehydrogenase/methenyl tetrahydrofolate cyclohydrolase